MTIILNHKEVKDYKQLTLKNNKNLLIETILNLKKEIPIKL